MTLSVNDLQALRAIADGRPVSEQAQLTLPHGLVQTVWATPSAPEVRLTTVGTLVLALGEELQREREQRAEADQRLAAGERVARVEMAPWYGDEEAVPDAAACTAARILGAMGFDVASRAGSTPGVHVQAAEVDVATLWEAINALPLPLMWGKAHDGAEQLCGRRRSGDDGQIVLETHRSWRPTNRERAAVLTLLNAAPLLVRSLCGVAVPSKTSSDLAELWAQLPDLNELFETYALVTASGSDFRVPLGKVGRIFHAAPKLAAGLVSLQARCDELSQALAAAQRELDAYRSHYPAAFRNGCAAGAAGADGSSNPYTTMGERDAWEAGRRAAFELPTLPAIETDPDPIGATIQALVAQVPELLRAEPVMRPFLYLVWTMLGELVRCRNKLALVKPEAPLTYAIPVDTSGLRAYHVGQVALAEAWGHETPSRPDAGWRMGLHPSGSGGSSLFLMFTRQPPGAQDPGARLIGVCGGIHCWLTVEERLPMHEAPTPLGTMARMQRLQRELDAERGLPAGAASPRWSYERGTWQAGTWRISRNDVGAWEVYSKGVQITRGGSPLEAMESCDVQDGIHPATP